MTVYALGSGVQGSPGRVGRMRMSNRARTQAEMSQRFLAGVPELERLASQVEKITNGNFEVDTTNWLALSATIARNTTAPIAGTADLLCTITGAGFRGAYYSPTSQFIAGQRYSLKFKYKTSGPTMRVALDNLTTPADQDIAFGLNATTATEAVVQFTAGSAITSSSRLLFYRESSSDVAMTFNLDDVELKAVGVTADYAPSAIQLAPGQWHDATTNKRHMHIPDGFRLGNPETDADLLFTNTWSASDALQYGNNVNSNILATTACVYDIIIVPSASYAGGFQIGNGSNNAYYGTVAGPVVAGVPIRVGLNTLVPDANRKLTIKPTAAYTGNVKTSVFVKTLEA